MENFAAYLNEGVEIIVRQALRSALSNPNETAFILKFMAEAKKAADRRLFASEGGVHVPPFLIASISSQCNLFCAGCYARANNSVGESACATQLTSGDWARLFGEARALGVTFILLAGGEPLLRRDVIEAAAGFPEIVFPVFTNGTLFDEAMVRLFNKKRNLVPMLSLEGDAQQTDTRRGDGVHAALEVAMARLREMGILFGASITVTKENLLRVTDQTYIERLRESGCKVVVFVEYVPVDASAATAPDMEDRAVLLARQDRLRCEFDDMLLIAFPGDEEALGGCLAAGRGFFHISPTGDAEPCPFSPFSDTNLRARPLKDALTSPLFRKLGLGGLLATEHLGGCALFGREDDVRQLLVDEIDSGSPQREPIYLC
ncbi:radical SAM protein [Oscillospiraceae bacterium CM]|nr:radical SAM protein [Oscillospiraceae bacterium CM]